MELPLTDAVIARIDELDTIDPCDPPGMPSSMATPLPIQFVERQNLLELQLSVFEAVRIIHMDDDGPDADTPPTLQGYSWGRWNGNTLEVRTQRVSWPYFDDGAIPQTENVDILEEFTLSDNGTALDYLMTVSEPETFTEPVTLRVALGRAGRGTLAAALRPLVRLTHRENQFDNLRTDRAVQRTDTDIRRVVIVAGQLSDSRWLTVIHRQFVHEFRKRLSVHRRLKLRYRDQHGNIGTADIAQHAPCSPTHSCPRRSTSAPRETAFRHSA